MEPLDDRAVAHPDRCQLHHLAPIHVHARRLQIERHEIGERVRQRAPVHELQRLEHGQRVGIDRHGAHVAIGGAASVRGQCQAAREEQPAHGHPVRTPPSNHRAPAPMEEGCEVIRERDGVGPIRRIGQLVVSVFEGVGVLAKALAE